DLSILQPAVEALVALDRAQLLTIVETNRQIFENLGRSTGRYLGIISVRHPQKINLEPGTLRFASADVYLFSNTRILEELASQFSAGTAFANDVAFFQLPEGSSFPYGSFHLAFSRTLQLRDLSDQDES